MFEALSVAECRPSERIEIAPVARPSAILAAATARLSTSTRRSTLVICAKRAAPARAAGGTCGWDAWRQKTRAWGTGHHRTWTLPMMYFFGTMPQWRLSELLFRWSPMTK